VRFSGQFPRTPEEIEQYKEYMISRYNEDAERNKQLLHEIRQKREERERLWATMSEKEKRKSMKVEKQKAEKERQKAEKAEKERRKRSATEIPTKRNN
jgi:hypothetical protein